jgi:poly(3-hydroxybutyrate) depolymerase
MRFVRSLTLLAAFLSFAAVHAAPPALPALGADGTRVSVSGLSSGGYMAAQYDVAFSAGVIGAGIIAGGPYNCAANYGPLLFIPICMQGKPSAQTSLNAAKSFAKAKAIDPLSNIKAQRIYLFTGTKDSVVNPTVMKSVRNFYVAAKVPAANLLYVNTVPAGHAFISTETGNPDCSFNGGHYIDKCTVSGVPYDQPAVILTHIYGPLKPKAAALSASPVAFDQTPFTKSTSAMASTGYVYIPAACQASGAHCAVHVVFHGCGQGAAYVGDDVYGKVGYNGWADANGIIMLYPQVEKLFPINPQGCWDWWGYTGANFALQGGAQIAAVHAMVAKLEAAVQ